MRLLISCGRNNLIDQSHKSHDVSVPYPHYNIQNRHVHISVPSGVLWGMEQVHCVAHQQVIFDYYLNILIHDSDPIWATISNVFMGDKAAAYELPVSAVGSSRESHIGKWVLTQPYSLLAPVGKCLPVVIGRCQWWMCQTNTQPVWLCIDLGTHAWHQ